MVRDWFRFATFPLAYSLREPAFFRLPFACGSNPRFVCSNPIMCDKNKMVARTIWFLWRMVRDSNPRWSRPHNGFQDRRIRPLCQPSETFFFFPVGLSNLRFCSLIATDVAAHHSLAFGFTAFALLTRMQDRRRAPSANHPKLLCHRFLNHAPFIFWHDKCQMFFILIFNFYFHICQPLYIKFHCDTFC